MKKLLSILFLASSLQVAEAENTNLISKTSTNYPVTKIETNNNWRIEAEKYPIHYCPQIYVKEKGVRYSSKW